MHHSHTCIHSSFHRARYGENPDGIRYQSVQHLASQQQLGGPHLEEAVLSEGDKGDGHGGDEAAGNGDERADEDKQRQQSNPRNGQRPHASCRQRGVH